MIRNAALQALFVTVVILGPAADWAPAQGIGSGPIDAEQYQAFVDDIEIMKRVIGKTLQGHFKGQMKEQFFRYHHQKSEPEQQGDNDDAVTISVESGITGIGSGFFRTYGTATGEDFDGQAFYVPGSGAVFRFEVAVAALESSDEQGKDETSDDLWKETELEYLRREHALAYTLLISEKQKDKNWIPDPEALEKVIDLLIETIGSHGHNIAGLAKNDTITLILGVKARIPQDQVLLPPGDAAAIALYYSGAAHRMTVKLEEVYIQIPVTYIALFQETQDRAALKKAVTVLRYPTKGEEKKGSER